MIAKSNLFYLGKFFDLKKGKILDEKLLYDPPDLTTHAIVTGMTGSGKTGLCVGLLEEAALQGIPAIAVDPKGDLANLLLHFPDLTADDFQPWVDPDSARRENKDVLKMAADTAKQWKNGLADWGLGSQDIKALQSSVQYAIYTPGSSSGIPINILASFAAPEQDWKDDEEALREKISSIITALLTLIGLKNIDPLRSREHILLSNIIEIAWRRGESLDLQQLILQTQNPPLAKLGAFELDDFFPKKDRSELAILLNNFLASPSFQIWIEGQPLDVEQLLFSEEGKARHNIIYLAHLSETERMFFVTLLFAAVESWMRSQRGSGNLRAMVYFDEILGYLPPIANPPSKPLLIRLLKQARAFGVGLVLTTQNPVDVDYKALSNAGTWMIGRLQTDQDKQRLLDGLEGATGGVKRSDFDKLISSLKKRVFLYHNVHEKKPQVFHTRWVMNYLAGPLTRSQIPALNALAGAAKPDENATQQGKKVTTRTTTAEPKESLLSKNVPAGVKQYFISSTVDNKGKKYQPGLLAIAEASFYSRSPNINTSHIITGLVESPRQRGQDWQASLQESFDASKLSSSSPKNANFSAIPEWMENFKWWQSQEKEFEQWIYETDTITVLVNKNLNLTADPHTSPEDFLAQSKQAAQAQIEKETAKLNAKYKKKHLTLENKIERQQQKVDSYRKSLASRGLDSALKVGETVFKVLTKKKLTGVSSTSTKVRMASEAKARLDDAQQVLEGYQEEFNLLKKQWQSEKQFIEEKWSSIVNDYKEIKLTPTKQKIRIEKFGLIWLN